MMVRQYSTMDLCEQNGCNCQIPFSLHVVSSKTLEYFKLIDDRDVVEVFDITDELLILVRDAYAAKLPGCLRVEEILQLQLRPCLRVVD